MPNFPSYGCGVCSEMFDAYDAHRRTIHGRTADGTLTIDVRPKIEQRIAALERQIAALDRRIEVLCATIDAMKKASEKHE